jgi:hypothetical protein
MQQLAILLACTQSLGRWLRLLNGTMIRDYFSLHTITYTAAPHGSPPLSVLPLQYLTQKQVKFMMVADVLLFLQHFHYYCVCIGLIISIMEFNVMANLKKSFKKHHHNNEICELFIPYLLFVFSWFWPTK